jgi:enterochelin esterase-like enzyme
MPSRRVTLFLGVVVVAAAAMTGVVMLAGSISGTTRLDTAVHTTIYSRALGRDMRVAILLPARLEPSTRYPVVYLFHGYGADETSWLRGDGGGIGVEGIVADLVATGRIPQLVIVSAEIDNSYGVDSPPSDDRFTHGAYERYIIDDLIPGIESRYPVATDPAKRFIAGYSMGGFAALHAAFRHPAMFAGVAGLSPAVFRGVIPDRAWLYPDPAARAANDPLRLAATADVTGMRVFLGYGSADYPWIVVATRDLADRLAARGVAARPVSVSGGHETRTWRALAAPMLVSLLGSPPTP